MCGQFGEVSHLKEIKTNICTALTHLFGVLQSNAAANCNCFGNIHVSAFKDGI